MSQSVVEKTVCGECGVDVRENTFYCYSCGTKIDVLRVSAKGQNEQETKSDTELQPIQKPDQLGDVPADGRINTKGREALDELARRIRIEDSPIDNDAIARAAANRKRSRIAKRRGIEYVWEPVDEPPGKLLFILVGFVVLLTIVAVIATVIWK